MPAEAHRRDIRIVMDLVVNHTSDEHAWFVESRSSKDNPRRDFYFWRDAKDGKEPNNWGSCFGGSAWEYDETTQQYYLHCFSKKQPDLNWDNAEVRDAVFDMMQWWCEKGIDGFRMDVISMISKVAELPDGEVLDGLYGDFTPHVSCGPKVHDYIKEMNTRVLSHYDLLTVGEVGNIPVDEAVRFANSDQTELGMVFQFEHVELVKTKIGKWTDKKPTPAALRQSLFKWQNALEGRAWNSLYLDNHDQPRAVSRFGNDLPEYRERSAKMLATLLHMMKGTPYIYQGEELGMTNVRFSKLEEYRDIESINAYHKFVDSGIVDSDSMLRYLQEMSRDNARTPMQWSDEANAGFTTGTPWISVNPNYREINAKSQVDDPDSVFFYYRKLIALRHRYPVIAYGRFEGLLEDDEKIIAYARQLGGQALVVACNMSQDEVPCDLFDDEEGEELISNYAEHKCHLLAPYEARVILLHSSSSSPNPVYRV